MKSYLISLIFLISSVGANPSVLVFTAKGCMFSQEAKQAISQNEALIDFLGGKSVIDVSADSSPELAQKYNVVSFPTYVFLDQNGRETWRDSGYADAEELLKMMISYYDKPDGLPEILNRLKTYPTAMDLYIAAVQLIGRKQFSEAIRLIRAQSFEKLSNLERRSINSLMYRAAAGLEDYSILLNGINNAVIHGKEEWEFTGQPALDEFYRTMENRKNWGYFFESLQKFLLDSNQNPGFYFSLSNAYLHSKTKPILGYHYAKKAVYLAKNRNQLNPNHYFLLRNWSKHFGLRSRQQELEKHILLTYGIDVSAK